MINHTLSGATTADILVKLPGILASLPSTVSNIILHIGTNDTLSLVTRANFKSIFTLLSSSGLSVHISGPLPTLNRGDLRLSRLLQLHYWLQSACLAANIHYIPNFFLFWNRPSFYSDGLHPSKLGCEMLKLNLRRSVAAYNHYPHHVPQSQH